MRLELDHFIRWQCCEAGGGPFHQLTVLRQEVDHLYQAWVHYWLTVLWGRSWTISSADSAARQEVDHFISWQCWGRRWTIYIRPGSTTGWQCCEAGGRPFISGLGPLLADSAVRQEVDYLYQAWVHHWLTVLRQEVDHFISWQCCEAGGPFISGLGPPLADSADQRGRQLRQTGIRDSTLHEGEQTVHHTIQDCCSWWQQRHHSWSQNETTTTKLRGRAEDLHHTIPVLGS